MKKKIVGLLAMATILCSGLALASCNGFGDFSGSDSEFPQIDNAVDLNVFTPATDDENTYLENETYYTSKSVDLVTEIHGRYSISRPFTLDKDDANKRIYHNIYFYEEDYFQVLYYKDVNALGSVYAVMSDETDTEYAELEYTGKGSPLQINITKKGVYNLVLDIQTLGIDMIKVGDIDTPVYEKITSCELNIHVSLENYTYTPMTLDTATGEYYIQAEIPLQASIGFYSDSHISHYKMEVEPSLKDTLIYWNFNSPSQVRVHVGGTYKIYFHAKTYVLRLELQNPDTASYYCQVGWKENKELTAVSPATPYLFEHEYVVEKADSQVPSIYPYLGMKYALYLINDDGFVEYDTYFAEAGTYKLTVNLKEFTLTIEKI